MRGSGNTLEIRQRWLISRSQQVSILTAWGLTLCPGWFAAWIVASIQLNFSGRIFL
jgi:hypothetical protein